jgi:hypothetical protein
LSNPVLLQPSVDILLGEFREAGTNDEGVAIHLALLGEARTKGVRQAYAPRLAESFVAEWESVEGTEEFIVQRNDEMLSPEVTSLLEHRANEGDGFAKVALAILTMTRRSERSVAYKILRDAQIGIAMLPPALASPDAERLHAIATLSRYSDTSDPRQVRLATVALAVAEVLAGRVGEAIDLVTDVRNEGVDESERAELGETVAQALVAHVERAGDLLGVLRVLRPANVPATPEASIAHLADSRS